MCQVFAQLVKYTNIVLICCFKFWWWAEGVVITLETLFLHHIRMPQKGTDPRYGHKNEKKIETVRCRNGMPKSMQTK